MTPLPDRLLLPLTFDAGPMAAEVAALARSEWIRHFVVQNYDGEWDVVPLRAKAGATHPVIMIFSDPAASHFVDTPFLLACPAFRAALAAFACPLLAVRLMRLGPGLVIKKHVDPDLDAEQGTVRLHLPAVTPGGRCPAQRPAGVHGGGKPLIPAPFRPAFRREPGRTPNGCIS